MRGRFTTALLALMAVACAEGVLPEGAVEKEGSTGAGGTENPDPPVTCEGVDLDNDPTNCGECARSCLGGSCMNGHCTPVDLYNSSGYLDDLAVVDDAVYVKESGDLIEVALPSGQRTLVDTLETGWAYTDVVVDAQRIYWGAQGGLFAMSRQGGAAEMLLSFDELDEPDTPAALTGGSVYFFKSTYSNGYQLWSFQLDFSMAEQVSTLTPYFNGRVVSAGGNVVVWADGDDMDGDARNDAIVGHFDRTSKTVTSHMIASDASITDLVVGQTAIYATVYTTMTGQTQVQQLALDGSAAAGMPLYGPNAMAADDTFLYVAANNGTYDKLCAVTSSGASFSLIEEAGIEDVAVDGKSVILRTADRLIRIAKPTASEASLAAINGCTTQPLGQ